MAHYRTQTDAQMHERTRGARKALHRRRDGVRARIASVSEGNYDVMIVGAGPSGAACAYRLAERGRRVLVVDKSTFPRDKTCGDGLTPRAVRQLNDMGLADRLADHQRFDGLR